MESTINLLHMQSLGQSLNSQGQGISPNPQTYEEQGPFVRSETEDFIQECGQIPLVPG